MFVVTGLCGLLMLVGGAELLVRGGGQLALALKIPALVVGLTIVAFGTSTPELAVSVSAAWRGSTDMALANINGSNVANILLVLGVASLVNPLRVDRTLLGRELPILILLQLFVPLFCWNGVMSRVEGGILLAMGVGYNLWLLYSMIRGRKDLAEVGDLEDDIGEAGGRWYVHLGFLLGGLVVLAIGAQLFVGGATEVARALNVSERYIGLSVLALGTSAPEVATSVVGAYRGEVDLAVGNSIGSNMLNISMVLGSTAMVMPIVVEDPSAWSDMGLACAATLLLVPIVLAGGRLGRVGGAIMASAYVLYLFWSA